MIEVVQSSAAKFNCRIPVVIVTYTDQSKAYEAFECTNQLIVGIRSGLKHTIAYITRINYNTKVLFLVTRLRYGG